VKDGRLGFAASSDESAGERLVTNALESAAYGDEIPLEFPAQQPARPVKTFDPKIADFPIPHLVEIGREILDILLPIEPEARINISLNRGVHRISLYNQTGAQISFQRSPLSIGVEISSVKEDDILIVYDMVGTTVWEDDYLAFARRLGEKLKLAKRLVPIRSGRMPVLFSPSGALVLGLPLMVGLDGKNVFTGISPLIGKLGERLFDPKITLVDDGTLDGKFGSAPYDDEGIAHRRTALIEQGVLKNFYYDLKTAVQSGVEPTGNGSRDLFNPPSPSITNLLIEPGTTPLTEIVSSIEEGLLVEDVLGLGQGNILSGAFSNPLGLAFKIEKGEIVGRVKNASIAGNVYELLHDVAAISHETQWIYNNFSLPYILLSDMNVVAKE
jgi:PmbA protein